MAANDGDMAGRVDEDRLPWLEPVGGFPDRQPVSQGKLAGFILAGLAVLAVVLGGIWWSKNRPGPDGGGKLIAAPAGDYKVKPDEPGGMRVEGEGDIAPLTSEGADPDGKIDLNAMPEQPVAAPKPAATGPAKPLDPSAADESMTAVPVTTGGVIRLRDKQRQSSAAGGPGTFGSGSLVQLGAYNNQADGNAAWAMLSKRFPWMADMPKQIVKAEVNERTVYRLRVSAANHGQAVDICKRLKVAGQDCLIAAE